jgi:hypothetical protein
MQQHLELIGRKAMTRRAIRFAVQFGILHLVFRLATSTVDFLVEHFGTGLLHIRHDKTRGDTWLGDFDLAHHAARARPRLGLVARRVKAGDLAPPAHLGSRGLLDHLACPGLQDGIARQTRHIVQPGLRFDPLHHLGVGKVAIAAKEKQGVR